MRNSVTRMKPRKRGGDTQQGAFMLSKPTLTLEYWKDDGWLVGRLREVPGVFSQGENLEELENNIQEAYRLLLEDRPEIDQDTQTKQLVLTC